MINKSLVIRHYKLFKKYAGKYYVNGQIENSLRYIQLAAQIGYKYNFQYCDDQLEILISNISDLILPSKINYNPNKLRVVFYDSFAIDNRGLTQQYLRALIDLNFEILFVCSSKTIGEEIKLELNNFKVKILHLTEKSFVNNIFKAINEIQKFKPTFILQHFSPWDVIGFCINVKLKDSKRFLINLTDHAYWLGKESTDYILEFRSYGAYISNQYRHISYEKLLKQPYYPIAETKLFLGFPKEVQESKTLLFAGASYYKIYGKKGIFLTIIKRILNENPNAVFLFAGSGDKKPIEEFISKNNLKNRFILLGDRSDINEVIRNVDIYINTYPMIGGLMSQYAAVNNKPIVGFTDDGLFSFNDVEDFLQINEKNRGILVKNSLDEFYTYVASLINNNDLRNTNISLTKNCIINPEEFCKQLKLNLESSVSLSNEYTNKIKINISAVFELYVDIEANFLNNHYLIIWESVKYRIVFDNIIVFKSIIILKSKILLNNFTKRIIDLFNK